MKISVLLHYGGVGGGTLSCFDVIQALMEDKNEIILVLPKADSSAHIRAQNLGIRTVDYNIKPIIFPYYNGGANSIRSYFLYLSRLKFKSHWKKLLIEENPDIVLFNSIIDCPMISITQELGLKSIVFVRETIRGNRSSYINRFIACKLEKANAVSFLSKYDKESWELKGDCIQKVIPDTVDIEAFSEGIDISSIRNELGLNSNTFYILYLGGVKRIKGILVLLKALNRCKNLNVKLLILGYTGEELLEDHSLSRYVHFPTINYIKRVYKYIDENNLGEQIIITEPQDRVNKWYAACDVVVFPAIIAHQARPIYEAGVFRKPVITTDFINYYEYLIPNESGLVFKNGDFQDLTSKIIQIFNSKKLAEKMGEMNNKMTRQFHDSKIIYEKIRKLVKSIN